MRVVLGQRRRIRLEIMRSWRNDPVDCRSACRSLGDPSSRYDGLGFRVALRVSDTSPTRSSHITTIGTPNASLTADSPTMAAARIAISDRMIAASPRHRRVHRM
jgi:hypothetical protein